MRETVAKIGEGVNGEVFACTDAAGDDMVLKVSH